MKQVFCTKETVPSLTNGIFISGDCIHAANIALEDHMSEVTLIYLDPPFCTGSSFMAGSSCAYTDSMPEDKYMSMMRQLLTLSHRLLADDGSLYLHIDYRMSAKLKLLLDEIFGAENFRNEIIWSYRSGGSSKKHFPRKHDTIFFYSKTANYYFDLSATGTLRGSTRRNNMRKCTDTDGRIYYTIISHGKEYRYYEDDLIPPTDVWTDIEHLHQRDKERTGYPTQKPLALLSRIISASSYEGAYVCDFFSGSGTTAHAAGILGRRWIASDTSPLAYLSLRKRLPCGSKRAEFIHTAPAAYDPHVMIQDGIIYALDDTVRLISTGVFCDGVYAVKDTCHTGTIALPRYENAAFGVTDMSGRTFVYISED